MTAVRAGVPRAAVGSPLLRWVLLLPVLGVMAALLLGYRLNWPPPAYATGAVILLWAVTVLALGKANPLALAMGADGIPSASKFQNLLWTLVFVFSYVLLWSARAAKGDLAALTDIPANIIIAMGLSIGTMMAAKGIKVAQVEAALVSPPENTDTPAKNGGGPRSAAGVAGLLAKDDLVSPDLTKIQMLAWTVIAGSIYLLQVWQVYASYSACVPLQAQRACSFPGFPDIDTTLMVLMGLGQGAYIGFKAVDKPIPAAEATQRSHSREATAKLGNTVVFTRESRFAGRSGDGA